MQKTAFIFLICFIFTRLIFAEDLLSIATGDQKSASFQFTINLAKKWNTSPKANYTIQPEIFAKSADRCKALEENVVSFVIAPVFYPPCNSSKIIMVLWESYLVPLLIESNESIIPQYFIKDSLFIPDQDSLSSAYKRLDLQTFWNNLQNHQNGLYFYEMAGDYSSLESKLKKDVIITKIPKALYYRLKRLSIFRKKILTISKKDKINTFKIRWALYGNQNLNIKIIKHLFYLLFYRPYWNFNKTYLHSLLKIYETKSLSQKYLHPQTLQYLYEKKLLTPPKNDETTN